MKLYLHLLFIALSIFCSGFFVDAVFAEEATSADVLARRAQLEKELSDLEKAIDGQQAILQTKQRESASLERDIAIFDAQIKSAELGIKARDLQIKRLGVEISGKEKTIDALSEKIVREKTSLSALLRRTRELDNYSLIEVVLNTKDLSEFFKDLDDFVSIKIALQESFDLLETAQAETRGEKEVLEGKQSEEEELRKLQALQKKRIEENKSEKNALLKATKGQEALYQKVIATIEKSAAVIRSELFVLRGTDAIPFEKALEYANLVSEKTGVRPALLLGVIAEESNLGQNVGTGTWRVDMHPTRDRPIFEEIARRLGLNPDVLPVSKKPWYGWGGAMGPAQFIPSTWILYESKIANLTGHYPPNPWNPYDAFIAAGVLLRENGAAKGGYTNERLAALRYFAGWKNATKSAYAFYGDEVMALAAKYQKLIDILQAN